MKTPSFRFGKIHIQWFYCCSDKFHRDCVHHPATICILQSRLRTRCVGFSISSLPACKCHRILKYTRSVGCDRTIRGWGSCRNKEKRFVAADSISPHFFLLFVIVLEQLIKLEFLAQQAEGKWLKMNKWRIFFHSSRVKFPLVSMSASWNLNFGIKIFLVKQPIQNNSVGSWHVSHWISALDYHLNHDSVILKDIHHSMGTRMCPAWWNVIIIGQNETGVRCWNLFSHDWLSGRPLVSAWLSHTFGFGGLVRWRKK